MESIVGGSSSRIDGLEDEVAPGGRGVALVQTPTPPEGSQDESAGVLASAAIGRDFLAPIIGPYTASSLSSFPTRIFHAGATW